MQIKKINLIKAGLVILFIFQLLDGYLTYLGVTEYNTLDIEGNLLIRYLMSHLGVEGGLIFAKALACLIIFIMYNNIQDFKSKWFLSVLCFVLLFYLAAIVLWVLLLF